MLVNYHQPLLTGSATLDLSAANNMMLTSFFLANGCQADAPLVVKTGAVNGYPFGPYTLTPGMFLLMGLPSSAFVDSTHKTIDLSCVAHVKGEDAIKCEPFAQAEGDWPAVCLVFGEAARVSINTPYDAANAVLADNAGWRDMLRHSFNGTEVSYRGVFNGFEIPFLGPLKSFLTIPVGDPSVIDVDVDLRSTPHWPVGDSGGYSLKTIGVYNEGSAPSDITIGPSPTSGYPIPSLTVPAGAIALWRVAGAGGNVSPTTNSVRFSGMTAGAKILAPLFNDADYP